MNKLLVVLICFVLLTVGTVSRAQDQDSDPEEYFNWSVNGETWVRLTEIQKNAWLMGFLHGLEIGLDAFGLVVSDLIIHEQDLDILIENAEILNVHTPIAQIREELDQYYSDPEKLDVQVAALILIDYCAGSDKILFASDTWAERKQAAEGL